MLVIEERQTAEQATFPSPRPALTALPPLGLVPAFLALAAALLFFAAPASADFSFADTGQTEFGQAGKLVNPEGVAVSRQSGDVYVVETADRRVSEFEADGTFVRAFGWHVDAASPEEKLQSCTALSGCMFGSEGSGPGQFRFPDGIAVDNDPSSLSYGDVWVADANNRRVEKFSPQGEFLLMLGGEVDQTTHADICTKADLEAGDICGAGVEGTGPGQFQWLTHIEAEVSGDRAPIATSAAGVLYVGDAGSRVQRFEPDGERIDQLAIPGSLPVAALAVDDACAQHEPPLTELTVPKCSEFDPANGDFYVHQDNSFPGPKHQETPGVQKYAPGGAALETLDPGTSPDTLAVGGEGELLVGDSGPPPYVLREYTSSGTPFAAFGSDQIEGFEDNLGNAERFVVPGSALTSIGSVAYMTNPYAIHPEPFSSQEGRNRVAAVTLPQPGPPLVKEEEAPAAGIEPTTAVLHALVNPQGFPTSYRFQWLTRAQYLADGEQFTTGTEESGGSLGLFIQDDPVSAAPSGLVPETAYIFRVLAENECNGPAPEEPCTAAGPVEPFETLPPVSVRDFTTQTVAPELVTFKAELSPNNGTGTEWEVCLGENQGEYDLGCVDGGLEPATVGNEFEAVTATFEKLEPGTAYHYQLSAENSYGIQVKSADQTFTTEETVAERDTAQGCANESLRAENHSLALPDCRAYEQVSPAAKNGYAIRLEPHSGLAAGGEVAGFDSSGSFAGATYGGAFNYYAAHRTGAGWVTAPALRRPTEGDLEIQNFEFFNAGLDKWLYDVEQGGNSGDISTASAWYVGGDESPFRLATPIFPKPIPSDEPIVELVAASADFSHLLFLAKQPVLPGDPWQEAGARIYEVEGVGGPAPSVHTAAEAPHGVDPECQLDAGAVVGSEPSELQPQNLLSADGNAMFYESPLELVAGGQCTGAGSSPSLEPNKTALFVRFGEAPPLKLSTPPPAQCQAPAPCASAAPANAFFWGASPDASLAWFSTDQPLIESDTGTGRDLYVAKLENGGLRELVDASGGDGSAPPGTEAKVSGAVKLSQDGTHAYFAAAGVLTTEANGAGEAAAEGAENIYVFDASSGTTKFVAEICTGPGESGTVPDPACPSNLSSGSGARNDHRLLSPAEKAASLSLDGRYLLFESFARLTSDDSDNAADVYRYDDLTGQLTRVSIGRNGNDGNGNDGSYDASIPIGGGARLPDFAAEDGTRSISADGAVAIFETAAPLVSSDTDGAVDVYEWEEEGRGGCREAAGCVSLISSGVSTTGSNRAILSASGRDVLFPTAEGLVPGDSDGVRDLYDAREGGGFPYEPPEPPCAAADTCHGPATEEGLRPSYTSEETHSDGNPPQPIRCAKGRHRVKRHGQIRCVKNPHHKKHAHRKHARRAGRQGK
jgi:hypothetical protein